MFSHISRSQLNQRVFLIFPRQILYTKTSTSPRKEKEERKERNWKRFYLKNFFFKKEIHSIRTSKTSRILFFHPRSRETEKERAKKKGGKGADLWILLFENYNKLLVCSFFLRRWGRGGRQITGWRDQDGAGWWRWNKRRVRIDIEKFIDTAWPA